MFNFYVKPDNHFIEKEIEGENKKNRANAKHIKRIMSSKKRYPVLNIDGDYILVPDDEDNLRLLHRNWFKMTGVVKYSNKSI